MKVLLIGSTGFIGGAIFEELLLKEIPCETITRQEWDLNDPSSTPPIFSDITHIINAAGCTDFNVVDRNWNTNFYSPIKLFQLYKDIPILHFGTAWTDHVEHFQTPYLKSKKALEVFAYYTFENVTILKPSIVTSHSWFHYLPHDKFFGFGIHCAKSGCYDDIKHKQWDLVPVDWIAQVAVEMLSKPPTYNQYNFSQGTQSETLEALFNCYKDIELVGQPDKAFLKRLAIGEKVYRPYLELGATFSNTALQIDGYDLPPSVVDINQAFVDKLNPKTILLKGEAK